MLKNYSLKSVLLISFLGLQTPVFAKQDEVKDTSAISSDKTPLPLEKIKTFSEIFTQIKTNYVEDVTDEELLDFAIKGMLEGLDPHSAYFKEDDFTDLKEGTSGRFGGLGMEVVMENGFVKVVTPIDDTPAARAGMKTGDLIIRIDDKSVSNMSLTEAVDLMRGEPGSEVVLTIVRDKQSEPFELTLERDLIQVETVKSKLLEDDIGYIRVTQFQAATAELLRKQLQKLADAAETKKLAGLILDMRNNPGGLLNSAVSIADTFITEGVLLTTKTREEARDLSYSATPNDALNGAPIVVLINGGSASASEIVAGALQDRKRGLIMGTQSFGKGSVQTVMNVGEKVGIKLTTARYFTPSGRSIQALGITPDIEVEQREFKEAKNKFKRIKEKGLSGHLNNTDKSKTKSKSKAKETKKEIKDYQLYEALNLLKGMALFQTPQVISDSVTEQQQTQQGTKNIDSAE